MLIIGCAVPHQAKSRACEHYDRKKMLIVESLSQKNRSVWSSHSFLLRIILCLGKIKKQINLKTLAIKCNNFS